MPTLSVGNLLQYELQGWSSDGFKSCSEVASATEAEITFNVQYQRTNAKENDRGTENLHALKLNCILLSEKLSLRNTVNFLESKMGISKIEGYIT